MSYTKGFWKIRTTVDESGDCPLPTYDIIAVDEWGPELIGIAYQNPNNARMFASAPELLEALQDAVKLLESATGFDTGWHNSIIAKALGK